MTIRDIINKIIWNKNSRESYEIFYLDRISKKLEKVNLNDIMRLDGDFLKLHNEQEEAAFLPLHRIRLIKKNNRTILDRTK